MMHNLKTMQPAFYQSESDQPHPGRARAIIKAHPEVRQLMVRNPWTALIALSVVVVQTSLAFCFGKLGFGYWWLSLVMAYCVGAFATLANYVLFHTAPLILFFRIKVWTTWVGFWPVLRILIRARVVYFCGWPGFLYLAFSFFFSIGLHPVGARWIQEHYTNDPEQETYSYYGPINRLALNMGYHNEHHDLPSIPWNNLPKLRAMAPE